MGGGGVMWESSVSPSQFCCEYRMSLKKSLKKVSLILSEITSISIRLHRAKLVLKCISLSLK